MVKMKALRTFGIAGANEGPVKRGREFEASDMKRAAELEAHGLAYRLDSKATLPPANKMEQQSSNQMIEGAPKNKAAETGPFVSAGGETGAAEPAPSSPPARQRRGRRSNSSEGDLLS